MENAPHRTPWASVLALAVSVAIALAAGWLGSLATAPNIPTWYAGLAKPAFNPPNEVFPIVWTILYILMAVAAWLVWRATAEPGARRNALVAYGVQLVLNLAWSFAFFGAQSPLTGLVVIVPLVLAIVWTIVAFRRVSRTAAWLLVPYLAWVSFATVLNGAIFVLNS
jgi:translocator protein